MNRRIRIIALLLVLVLLVGLTPQVSLRAQAEDDYTDLTIDFSYSGNNIQSADEIMDELGRQGQTTNEVDENFYKDAVNNPVIWRHATKWTLNSNEEGSIRKYLTSTDPADKYISLTADDRTEYHRRTAWETMVVTTDKVLDLNGHVLDIQYNRNRNNSNLDRSQNNFSDVHNCVCIEVTNGATLTIIDSSAWRGEGTDGKGKGRISFTGYMVDPYKYDINWYTTRDLFKVSNGNLVVYGGTFQAGRKKDQLKSKFKLSDVKTIVGNAVSLGVSIAEYYYGVNTAEGEYADVLKAIADNQSLSEKGDTGEDDGTDGKSETIKKRDGTDAPEEPKKSTPTEEAKTSAMAGRNRSVQEKKEDKNKEIAEGKKTEAATPEGRQTGNDKENSTAKNDDNTKLANAENKVVSSYLDKDKIMGMVDSVFDLGETIAGLFIDDNQSRVTQSIKGTAVSVLDDGVFVAYGGTFQGYGSTPNTRNAVIEVVRQNTRRVNDKTKFNGGLAYIYGGTYEAYNGANVFNLVKTSKNQTVYQVVGKPDGTREVVKKTLTEAETQNLQTLYYEDQDRMGEAGFPFTPIDTSNVQVRGGTFRCSFDLWNVAIKEGDGNKEEDHFCKFPGTSGSVNLGDESFGLDLIKDGRIQLDDPYGDGSLVLLDEWTEEPEEVKKAGLYHYRLFCSDMELRAKYYLRVYPNEALTNTSASMQLSTYQNNEKFAGSLWQNDKDNIRTPVKQTERYFEFIFNDSNAATYSVMPNFHDTESGKTDVYGKKLDSSELWYYPTPMCADNKTPIPDVELSEAFMNVGEYGGSSVRVSQQYNDQKTWDYYKNKYTGSNSYHVYGCTSHDGIRVGMRYFTYKIYRVDPLTRENLSESGVYGVDEPLIEVRYGAQPQSLRCKFPLLEVQEQIKAKRPDWAGYRAGEYYRIILDVEEYVGIGYNTTSYGSELPVAHTQSSVLFRCLDINETVDNGGAYSDYDFTPLQWIETPKAGKTAKIQIVNGKAGMTDYIANNKILDVYYQWWEVDENGEPVRLLAGTNNIYNGTGEKSKHRPSMWNVETDGKTYVNTVDPKDPKASTYGANGLPTDPKTWTDKQIHMYSFELTNNNRVKKNQFANLSLMNNNVFATNTDSCYIPAELAGKSVQVKAIVLNYMWPDAYDVKQTFTSHVFKVASAGSGTDPELKLTLPENADYAAPNAPVEFTLSGGTNAARTTSVAYSVWKDGQNTTVYRKKLDDLSVTDYSELPTVKFPEDFSDQVTAGDLAPGEYFVSAMYYYKDRLGFSGIGQLHKQSFRYEIPATSITAVNGTTVEVLWNDVQSGKYAEGLRVVQPEPENASFGFDYKDAQTTSYSVAFLDAAGLLRFGGAAGVTTITVPRSGIKPLYLTVRVAKNAAADETVANVLGENPFSDVKESAYYGDPVLWAVGHDPQVTNGTSATEFSPTAVCTRGQVVTFLWRALGCPEPSMTTHPFTDVKEGAYYYKAMLWAVEEGVTNGLSPTIFGPNEGCTRGQVVTFLWRAYGEMQPKSASHPFSDVKDTAFYFNAMLWAVENGVTNGLSPTTFGPGETCQRGQIVTFLFRSDSSGDVFRVSEQPGSGITDGTGFPLSVKVKGGTAPYTYQWHRVYYAAKYHGRGLDYSNEDRTPNRDDALAGATAAEYTATQDGLYYCVITDAAGTQIRSNRSRIGSKLTITYQPKSGYWTSVMSLRLNMQYSGGLEPVSIQWYRNGQPIAGATGTSYDASADGSYTCTVTDGFGQSVATGAAKVTQIGKSGVNLLGTDDFLIYAEEVYYVTDRGPVLQGRVLNGRVAPGDTLRLLTRDPGTGASVEREIKVTAVSMYGKTLDQALKGDYVGLLFSDLERGVLQYGDALVSKQSALHNLGSAARLTGKVELNDQRANPFKNGDSIQVYFNGVDVTASFINVNGEPIPKNTTREGVVLGGLSSQVCLYPGGVLTLRQGGREFGTFTITDIQN